MTPIEIRHLRLLTADAHATQQVAGQVLTLDNDADPREVSLAGVERVDLQFPVFKDGRAFSQAYLLRRRLRFAGEIRATGDVLVDQLPQMQRSGFDSAVLNGPLDVAAARRQLERYPAYYQADAVHEAAQVLQAGTA